MKPNIIHSIVVCLVALVLPLMVACSSHEESLRDTAGDTETAMMYLNIATIGHTRAGAEGLLDNEKMSSVRVIVLHEDGSVEHNRFYPLSGAQDTKLILLKVKPNEKKTVFLFANEESVDKVGGVTGTELSLTQFFESYQTDANGFADAVNDLYFAPDYTNGKSIPMSSMYELEMGENYKEHTLYVVRVATKFTVNFINKRGDKVEVSGLSVSSHADKNFLMAHVNNSEQNLALFGEETWIDWLREVSDASSVDDDYATTEAAGWLKDYELPTLATRNNTYQYGSSVTVSPATVDANGKVTPGRANIVPVFYLPESINLKDGETDGGEQEYTITLQVEEWETPFNFTLPNLKSLFRNTHAVVNVTMYKNLDITVDVIPYSEVILDPVFGLPTDDDEPNDDESGDNKSNNNKES